MLLAHIENGKSTQLSIGYSLYRIGRDRNIRITVVSSALRQAEKIVKTAADYITDSEAYHEVFPDVKPGKQWTNQAFTVARSRLPSWPPLLGPSSG